MTANNIPEHLGCAASTPWLPSRSAILCSSVGTCRNSHWVNAYFSTRVTGTLRPWLVPSVGTVCDGAHNAGKADEHQSTSPQRSVKAETCTSAFTKQPNSRVRAHTKPPSHRFHYVSIDNWILKAKVKAESTATFPLTSHLLKLAWTLHLTSANMYLQEAIELAE